MNPALIGLDPLFLTNAKLIIKDILALDKVQDSAIELFYLYNHVIKFVEICGTVVGVERGSTSTTYTVDDSTGTIACCLWNETYKFDYKPLEIGTSVRLDGKIATFRDERQIIVYNIYPLIDPNQELAHLLHTILLKDEYKKAFRLPIQIELNSEQIANQLDRENSQQLILNTQPRETLTEQAFDNAILEYCRKEYTGEFSATAFREVPHLIEMATQLLIERSNTGKISKRQISEQFSQGLSNLLNKGLVVESNKKTSLYKVVDEQRLAELIVDIISDMLYQTRHQLGGVRIEYIIAKVAEVEEYEMFGTYPRKIKDLVDTLVELSVIYPSGYNEYKITA